MTIPESSLLLALGGAGASEEAIAQAARAGGLDPYRLCLLLRGHGLLALGLGVVLAAEKEPKRTPN